MKIVIASSFVPFVNGGGRFIVEWLQQKLIEAGHEVELFYLPFVDRPADLLDQILAYRLIDLSQSCDRLIAVRPPAYFLPHPNKILWFIHHFRALYDLWDTDYRFVPDDPNGRAYRQAVIDADSKAIREARRIYTNSATVASRLEHYNGIAAVPLFPPVMAPERFRNDGCGEEIVSICRVESHKRQHLLIEAMRYVKSAVRLKICGTGMNPSYIEKLEATIADFGLSSRVTFDNRWISEEEKADLLATALAVAYLPADEDSYGYPSIEGAHAGKGVLTTSDSGGVLELVQDGLNGLVVPPEAQALAAAMDQLFLDRQLAARFGDANRARLTELRIDWQTVIQAMTS